MELQDYQPPRLRAAGRTKYRWTSKRRITENNKLVSNIEQHRNYGRRFSFYHQTTEQCN
jgi:hypothetical protein